LINIRGIIKFIKQFLYKHVIITIIVDDGLKILGPHESYKGRTYSEWIEEWSNLLVSATPDYTSGAEMLFLRGNLDYESDQSGSRFVKPGKFLDKTGNLADTIYKNTALFIPVMTAMFSLNDPYESIQLLDEEGLRYAVRRDISEGGKVWLRYKTSKGGYQPVIRNGNVKDYYFETAMFTLRVSKDSPLLGKFESPMDPAEYQTVQGGYFVILTDLSPGDYRFHFGGFGRGYYYTDAVYDIKVSQDVSRDLPEDVSTTNLSNNKGIIDIQKKTFLHLKTEDDIDNTSPFP
jgi:hypothetical protein